MVKTYQIALAGTVSRLSSIFAGDESKNIPFRQLLFATSGADAFLGSDTTVTPVTGFKVALTGTLPVSVGPFSTGPVKLSDFYGVGAGATLTILGVPY